jgi:hypothetical protein
MYVFRKTTVALGVVLSAAFCLAQPATAQSKKAPPVVAAKPCCQVLLMAPGTGEPVPGAEILIEQEPTDMKIAPITVVTDSRGIATFTVRAPGTVKFTVKLGTAQIGQLKKGAPKADKAKLVLKVTVGKKVTEHPSEVSLTSTSAVSSGPYSQSLSNIEDN